MNEIVALIAFYIVFMLVMSLFLWGRATERAYEFHKDMYWGRLLGRERYFALSRLIAIIGIIGATVGFVSVLCHALKTGL